MSIMSTRSNAVQTPSILNAKDERLMSGVQSTTNPKLKASLAKQGQVEARPVFPSMTYERNVQNSSELKMGTNEQLANPSGAHVPKLLLT